MPKVIQFTHGSISMKNTVLNEDEAPMSHSVFKFVEAPSNPASPDETQNQEFEET